MFKANALLILFIFSFFSTQAQTKEEFISFLKDMKETLDDSKYLGWKSVDKSSILDSVYFSETSVEEAKRRAFNFSNSLYFSSNNNEIYTYSEYPFGKYYYDSMRVTLEDGQQFYTGIEDGGHFSEGSFAFDPDTLNSPVSSVSGKVRYWYPDRVKVFTFDKKNLGKKIWKEGIYAQLLELEDNFLKVNIGPGDSLSYSKYYSTGYLEMRVYALNDKQEDISRVFGTSMNSMEGLSELIDMVIEKGKDETVDGEKLGEYMSGLAENEFANPGVNFAASVEGTIDQVMVVVRLEDDWDYVEDSVVIVPETIATEGWQRDGDVALNSDQIHVSFREVTADQLIAQSTMKASNHYNEYLEIYQPRVDLRLPWIDNEFLTGYQDLEVELTHVEFYKNKKMLPASVESSRMNTPVYYGFLGTLEKEKAIANLVKGEFSFDYATQVQLRKLEESQYTIDHHSIVSIPWDAMGYADSRDFRSHMAGQKVWAKNSSGDWLVMIDDNFYFKERTNSVNYCFAGQVTEVFVAEIKEGKEQIRIPFDLEIQQPD
ncbi:hypothetical protein N7E81_12605 [Reichenbachiella carrageenanivorans]|uniref:WG containing repeat-containing protein n=1 Tax=Reichenbachiella carrageenanivorans TaxID=2979869 RepID=A0ABY6CXV7_9BACT|nr:hypothetical protein [Reichenbachiella carrageenanivorans]UXX78199.1 hypothetical protein N7E81_12605 [Reichenbachiella carrageenanivorans]